MTVLIKVLGPAKTSLSHSLKEPTLTVTRNRPYQRRIPLSDGHLTIVLMVDEQLMQFWKLVQRDRWEKMVLKVKTNLVRRNK